MDEVEVLCTGFTSEGTAQLSQMLGNKDFPYPKPLSLITGLIKQSTGEGDIILDFFAGSGTTSHAVLALSNDDVGDRRFILASSTEATTAEPEKNVCRDITRPRLQAAIEGYSYKTKNGLKAVEGLGGDFAYLRVQRLATERLYNELAHPQV